MGATFWAVWRWYEVGGEYNAYEVIAVLHTQAEAEQWVVVNKGGDLLHVSEERYGVRLETR